MDGTASSLISIERRSLSLFRLPAASKSPSTFGSLMSNHSELRQILEAEVERYRREWVQQLIFAERFFGQEGRAVQSTPLRPTYTLETHWNSVSTALDLVQMRWVSTREVLGLLQNLLTGNFLHLAPERRRASLEELRLVYSDSLEKDQRIEDPIACSRLRRKALCQGRSHCLNLINSLIPLC